MDERAVIERARRASITVGECAGAAVGPEATLVFTSGYCGYLAQELEARGFGTPVLVSSVDGLSHIVTRVGDDAYLDIHGVRTREAVLNTPGDLYRGGRMRRLKAHERAEFMSDGGDYSREFTSTEFDDYDGRSFTVTVTPAYVTEVADRLVAHAGPATEQ